MHVEASLERELFYLQELYISLISFVPRTFFVLESYVLLLIDDLLLVTMVAPLLESEVEVVVPYSIILPEMQCIL